MFKVICYPRNYRIIANFHPNGVNGASVALELNRTLATERIAQPIAFTEQSKRRNPNNEKTTAYGWTMLLIPITTFGLGCWQVQRKKWKEGLLQELETQTSKPPVDFPDEIETLQTMEYQSVRVRGHFLHEREITMGPRSLIEKNSNENKGGLITKQDSSIGFMIITPFKIENRDHVILVNRGWVPRKFIDPRTREQGQITGTTELVGIVRLTENRPQFAPKSSGDTFLYRDIPQMSTVTGSDPYLLDATAASTIPGGPIGGQTRISLRNEHLSYIATWFSLSAFTAFLWYRQIYKRIPR